MSFDPFRAVTGPVAAFPAENIDTDVIMPKVFLKGIDRQGLDRGLFHDLRFEPDGQRRPGFVLNRTPWDRARFLVTGPNFGCGSSREHAVWGLGQFGIRAIIGTSFAGIFFDNCARNGLLAIEADPDVIAELTAVAQDGTDITVDLTDQSIRWPGSRTDFDIDATRRDILLEGHDPIDVTLRYRDEIIRFQRDHLLRHPWLA